MQWLVHARVGKQYLLKGLLNDRVASYEVTLLALCPLAYDLRLEIWAMGRPYYRLFNP